MSAARLAPLAILFPLLAATPAAARTGGIVGYSRIGCTDCHDPSGIAAPAIEIAVPATVDPGAEVAVRVVVTSMAGSQLGAGFNFAAEAGDVRVGDDPGVRRAENRESRRFEVTHTGPRENDAAGAATWSFIWVTPATPGNYALFASGNSVNLDYDSAGDVSAFTVRMVRVGAADPTPTPTVTPGPTCAGDCDGDGTVAINELIGGVNVALGAAPATACPAIDLDADGSVAINELVTAVSRALAGC